MSPSWWGDVDNSSRLMLDIASSADPTWRGPVGAEQLELAHHHGLLGLMATHPKSELREPAMPPFARLRGRQEIMVNHLRRLLERLDGAGIPASVLKGPDLATRVYRDSRHRTFTDVDVLVPETSIDAALAVLVTDDAVSSVPRKRPKADKRDIPVKDESGMFFMLDLHWDLFSYTQLRGRADGATDWAWQNSAPVADSVLGPGRRLPGEAYLAFLSTHALLDHRFRLILFRDLAEAVAGDFDWEALVEFSGRWGLRSFTYLALLLAIEIADARVPSEVMETLRPDSLPVRAIEKMLPGIDPARFDGHRPHPLNLATVLLHDDARERARLLVHAPVAASHWARRFGWRLGRRPPSAPAYGGNLPRVLVVVSSVQRRGAEVFAERLTQGLRGEGWVTDLVALAGGSEGPSVAAQPLGGEPPETLGRLNPSVVFALRRKVKTWHPDVVLANGGATLRYAAAALAGRSRRPRLAYASIGEPEYWIRGERHLALQRLLHSRADLVLAVSEATREQLVGLVGVPADRVEVAYTGVPHEMTEISSDPETGGMRILFLGNLSKEKDPMEALRVVADLEEGHDVDLRFVGSGPLEHRLREAAEGASQHIEFTGPVEDVSPHLRWADVLLLPSLTEGLPGAVLEAAAAAVPALAYDVGGTREIILDGETGFLVGPGDHGAMVERLERLYSDRELLRRLADAARQRVREQFSFDDTLGRYRELLESLLPERKVVGDRSRTRLDTPG